MPFPACRRRVQACDLRSSCLVLLCDLIFRSFRSRCPSPLSSPLHLRLPYTCHQTNTSPTPTPAHSPANPPSRLLPGNACPAMSPSTTSPHAESSRSASARGKEKEKERSRSPPAKRQKFSRSRTACLQVRRSTSSTLLTTVPEPKVEVRRASARPVSELRRGRPTLPMAD